MRQATLNIKPVSSQGPKLVPLNIQSNPRVSVKHTVKLNIAQPQITQTQPQITRIKIQTTNPTQPQITRIKIQPTNLVQTQPTQPSPGGTYRITASEYKRYNSTRDHIYDVTDAYIGSDKKMPRLERVLNLETMCFQEEEIHIPEGVESIFVEISANAGDNVARSLRHGIDPGEVTIKMDQENISIRNGGIPIPIEIHPKEKVWAPQMIFGMLHSSSNYDKTKVRTECGRNGYGAKLTNIFSKQFIVTIGDSNNKRWYRQIWTENMTVVSEPEIKEGYTGEAFVEIVYKMDFKRFGYEQYPEEAFRLFSRHCADMSFTGKVPVSFNGVKLNVQKSREYAKLYLGADVVKKSIVYYQWPPGTKTVERKGIQYALNKKIVPIVEICAVDTPDMALNVSFVNGKWTRNGGVHADAAFKAITSGLLTTVNGGNKGNKGKKKSRSHKLNLGDIKRHISMFVSCWIGDPTFDSQTKTALRSPTPKISIDEKILQPIMKWDLVNRLYAELEAKHFKASTKSDGRKKSCLFDLKGSDAGYAGKSRSDECTLYLIEGKSAMAFASKMISLFPEGSKFCGKLPLKGKPLNVMNAPPLQIVENQEIIEIKKMLGLRERVNYLDDTNFQTLRYGHLSILADADTDGKHILGLVLNLFHCKYPSLLARGYITYLRTKIIDVRKNQQYLKFYSNHEYEEWKAITHDWESWDHKYFKGLGSSKDDDIVDEFKAPKYVQCFYDEMAPMTMQLAFHEKLADQRKDWIRNWKPDFRVEEMQTQPISAFINHEFIQFSIADVARSIPRFMDGLKQVQRKIIWGSMMKWKGKVGSKKASEVKVSNLGSFVSELTEYHHGSKSIYDAITSMAQDFVGSNNLPFLYRGGQFGTREQLGKDASSARYIKTRPEWWWPLIFVKSDVPLLDMIVDEGKKCEPVTFIPIIPIHLINGVSGIGTGHSTFIPDHDPLDICQWLTSKINGYPLPPTLPWYRNFKGRIKIIARKPKKPKKKKNLKTLKIPTQKLVVSPSVGVVDPTQKLIVSHGPILKVIGLTPGPKPTPGPKTQEPNPTIDGADIFTTADTEDADETDEDVLDGDTVAMNRNTKYTMATIGAFTVRGNKRKTVIVTELPIGRGIHDYEIWLGKQQQEKVISGFMNNSRYINSTKSYDVHFEITGMTNPSLKNLRLIRSYGMSNMVLLDTNDRPIKYDSTYEILESFYAMRLPYYQLRKDNIIKEKQDKIDMLNSKIRFIIAVIDGYNLSKQNPNITTDEAVAQGAILAVGLSKKQILPQMNSLGFIPILLQRVTLYQCTLEEMQVARNELQKLINEKGEIEKIHPKRMWQDDIDKFVAAYCKEYKCKPTIKNNVTLRIATQ